MTSRKRIKGDDRSSDVNQRTDKFRPNERLDRLIVELSERLTPVQKQVNLEFEVPQEPIGLILGSPRSGTTVLLQFFAACQAFSYPTNLLSRFAYAPYVGALTQKMLFDPEYDYMGELGDIESYRDYASELGKSKGILAASEFFHFWRKYIPRYLPEHVNEKEIENIDFADLSRSLASVESALGKPFITKGLFLQYNLTAFYERMPYLFFIRIAREPIYVMQSIWFSRLDNYGSTDAWFSVKPREFESLRKLDVYHQIAGQVYYTERAIEEGLEQIPEDRQIKTDYEEFCSNPGLLYMKIVEKYRALGCELDEHYDGPDAFESSRQLKLPLDDIQCLESAYDDFVIGKIVLDN